MTDTDQKKEDEVLKRMLKTPPKSQHISKKGRASARPNRSRKKPD